jgi:hypothetical protein
MTRVDGSSRSGWPPTAGVVTDNGDCQLPKKWFTLTTRHDHVVTS